MSAHRVSVDGQVWVISTRDDQYDFEWISRPQSLRPYGFTARPSDPTEVLSLDDIKEMIREFMGNVNPETGYLD